MRHRKANNNLRRKTGHRKSMLANMSCSLIMHKRIKTTLAKAKVLKRFVEPIITKSKNDSTHNRRISFRYLRQKDAVTELFSTVSNKVADRPGGYTRIIKHVFARPSRIQTNRSLQNVVEHIQRFRGIRGIPQK